MSKPSGKGLVLVETAEKAWFSITPVGVKFKPGVVDIGEWRWLVRGLRTVKDARPWMDGDAYNYGEQHFPEQFTQFLDELVGFEESEDPDGYHAAVKTIGNRANVCTAFPLARRRGRPLRFAHHSVVYALDPKLADSLLARAFDERWSEKQLRAEAKRVKGNKIKVREHDRNPAEGEGIIEISVGAYADHKSEVFDALDEMKSKGWIKYHQP